MMIVSRTLSNLSNNVDIEKTIPFEEKIVCFCEDFRQILLVCLNKRRDYIINLCLKKIFFWSKVELLRLTKNMKLKDFSFNEIKRREVAQFAQKVLDIDNVNTTVFFDDNDIRKTP